MNRKSTGFARRAAAAVGAFALALLGAVAVASPAAAAPGNMPTEDGRLTIHKFEQPATGSALNNNGTAIAVPGEWVALSGVNFEIQRITDVDLTTNAGWDAAAAYAAAPATATQLGAATLVTTGSGGAVSADLPIGAYLVTEVASPAATLPDGSAANIVLTAAPFVVTVPIPTAAGTWNSDVHVYPKNSLTQVEKVASAPTGKGVGSTVTWTVESKIARLTEGESFTDITVRDTLDGKLEFVAPVVVTIDGTPVPATDYIVTHTGVDADGLGGTVLVDFENMALFAANQGKTLSVQFPTIVRAAGEIVNTADVFTNDPGLTDPVTSNPAVSRWGAIEITKSAAGDATKTLEGAVFTVHASQADADAGTDPISAVVDGVATTQFTTGPDGTVVIPGLYIGTDTVTEATYYVREIQAPTGYDVNANPVSVVTINSGHTSSAPYELVVTNPQKPAFRLPLTGGDGAVALSIAGGGLLATALGAALVVSRRRSATLED